MGCCPSSSGRKKIPSSTSCLEKECLINNDDQKQLAIAGPRSRPTTLDLSPQKPPRQWRIHSTTFGIVGESGAPSRCSSSRRRDLTSSCRSKKCRKFHSSILGRLQPPAKKLTNEENNEGKCIFHSRNNVFNAMGRGVAAV